MAKKYFSFDELKSVYGQHKPAGTMGIHHLNVSHGGGNIIVFGVDSYGVRSKEIILHEGETVGYDCGIIWRIPSPGAYKDPLRGILAEQKLSQKILSFDENFVKKERQYPENIFQFTGVVVMSFFCTERGYFSSFPGKLENIIVNPKRRADAMEFISTYFSNPEKFRENYWARENLLHDLAGKAESAEWLLSLSRDCDGIEIWRNVYGVPMVALKNNRTKEIGRSQVEVNHLVNRPEDYKIIENDPEDGLKRVIARFKRVTECAYKNMLDSSAMDQTMVL